MFRFVLRCAVFFASLLPAVQAGPVSPEALPEPLKPWVSWVLHDDHTLSCPFLYNDAQRQCRWPSRLSVQADGKGARFSQAWMLYGDGWALLPGDSRHWPQQVEVNGKLAAVTARDGTPAVFLPAGSYTVSGEFTWDKRPEFLQVPAISALIELKLDDEAVNLPEFDEQGRLWLRGKGQQAGEAEENRLELRVFRHALDGIPLRLTTRLELDIGGKAREVVLGPVMDSQHFIPMQLDSALPARLEPDGRLRLQVRPGSYVISLQARHQGLSNTLASPPAQAPWPEEEIWVFAAQNHLRQVEITGAVAVDPQQTGLPDEWKNLPAYRLATADKLELLEKRRGDPEPAPDRLSLNRQFWLDFDGQGYTVQDRVSGQMSQGWRLEMAEPGKLGRVAVDGQDQFITRLGGVGVEVRRGDIALEADSRLEDATGELPAVGWQHDFQSVSATLHLPPGWRLWHASGADNVPDTWIKQWTLLDLFVVLITALATGKLWNWRWGVLALLALALIWHEDDAPRWVFLNILAAMALLRVLPTDRWFTRLAGLYRNLALLALLVIAVPFMVQQARSGLFPQLEYPWREVAPAFGNAPQAGENDWDENIQPSTEAAPMEPQQQMNMPGFGLQSAAPPPPPAKPMPRMEQSASGDSSADYYSNKLMRAKKMLQIDPKAQVQTGPGLPLWQWRSVSMSWNGPVRADQGIGLFLMSPQQNLLLSGLRVLLLAGLVVFLLLAARKSPPSPLPADSHDAHSATPGAGLAAAALLCLLCLPLLALAGEGEKSAPSEIVIQNEASGVFPSDKRLAELKDRLLAAPDCLPYCAAMPRMHLELRPDALRLFLEIHAETGTAVPLPGLAWQQVWLDQQPAPALLRQSDDQVWLNLPAGIHQVQMSGNLPARASLQLPLPLRPQRVTVDSQGWQVEGVHENGLADETLQFTRESGEGGQGKDLEIGQLPPFVAIERTLLLGLEWQVETTVRRLTPPGSAVVLEIPLLPGESVTSEQPRVENGKALINLSSGETEMSWVSVFPKTEQIELQAPDTHAWREIWKLDASAIWHVQASGIPVIHHQDQGRWLPEWRPWPGERVTLAITRPEGVAGQISTIDASELQIRPSQRATDYLLQFSLRSSWGGQHPVLLPEGAELQSVHINGQSQPIRQEGRKVTLPITPGSQTVQLAFRQNEGIDTYLRTPEVDLGMSSVNHRISLHVPENRWVLFAGGPRLGPAVMFWGVFLIVVLVSAGLGRIKLTPLKTGHWFLLGLALSQVEITLGLAVVAWLFLLGWRREQALDAWPKWKFNLFQIVLAVLALGALSILAEAIREGLLGHPEMQIAGNGSSRYLLHWYQDQIGQTSPQAWMVSLPLMAYRLLMLAWALWLAFALLRWLRWGWECFSAQGLWRPILWPWRKKRG